jgi:hypothetical protein
MQWVTLKKYCQESGETPEAVRKRRQKGIWLDGFHTKVRNRRLWVNTKAAEQWVLKGS